MNKECTFDRGKTCAALKVKKCKNCSFFKTEEELEEGRKRAKKRINSLPIEQQTLIKMYYGNYERE